MLRKLGRGHLQLAALALGVIALIVRQPDIYYAASALAVVSLFVRRVPRRGQVRR